MGAILSGSELKMAKFNKRSLSGIMLLDYISWIMAQFVFCCGLVLVSVICILQC